LCACLSLRMATPRHCLRRLKHRSTVAWGWCAGCLWCAAGSVRAGAVALVGQHPVRAAPRPSRTPVPRHHDGVQHRAEHHRVVDVARRHHHRQRPALAIAGQMSLGRPATSRTTEGIIIRLSGPVLVVRSGPLCAVSARPGPPGVRRRRAGAPARSWNPPTPASPGRHRRRPHRANAGRAAGTCRPPTTGCAGRSPSSDMSRHGEPVRNRQAIPSRITRWSRHRPPSCGAREGSSGSIRSHNSSEMTSREPTPLPTATATQDRSDTPSSATSAARRTRP
jgi:hypothetical protein